MVSVGWSTLGDVIKLPNSGKEFAALLADWIGEGMDKSYQPLSPGRIDFVHEK